MCDDRHVAVQSEAAAEEQEIDLEDEPAFGESRWPPAIALVIFMPDTEAIVLHDPESEKSLVVLIFETDDDYARAHEILDAMPASDTPGSRTSVQKYDVAHRYKD